jgi:hypothetical protein
MLIYINDNNRLRVFEDRVLKKIFRPKREVTGRMEKTM